MSAYIQPGIFVRIEELESENAPRPLPLASGFDSTHEYEILGIHIPSETAEAYLMLKSDRNEIWFISNRHVRIVSHQQNESFSSKAELVQINGKPK